MQMNGLLLRLPTRIPRSHLPLLAQCRDRARRPSSLALHREMVEENIAEEECMGIPDQDLGTLGTIGTRSMRLTRPPRRSTRETRGPWPA